MNPQNTLRTIMKDIKKSDKKPFKTHPFWKNNRPTRFSRNITLPSQQPEYQYNTPNLAQTCTPGIGCRALFSCNGIPVGVHSAAYREVTGIPLQDNERPNATQRVSKRDITPCHRPLSHIAYSALYIAFTFYFVQKQNVKFMTLFLHLPYLSTRSQFPLS